MKRRLMFAVCLVALVGCDREDKADAGKRMIAQLRELTELLEGVTDEATARKAAPRVRELAEEWRETREAGLKADDNVDVETKRELAREYVAAVKRLSPHIVRIRMNPKYAAYLGPPLEAFTNPSTKGQLFAK